MRSDGARRRRWTWGFALAFVVGLTALVVWLTTFGDAGLSRADQMASVVASYIALVSFPVALINLYVALRQGDQAGAGRVPADQLAAEVRTRLAEEPVFRQIQAVPLQVRWHSTHREVAAGPADVLGEPGDWRQRPIVGEGQEIAEMFLSLPHGQLVIIGEAGAGKSVLAMQLTLGVLDARASGQAAPVLLSIASWNPGREPLTEFVARRLEEEYRFLREPDGTGLATRLLGSGEVVPVLDGFDEMPEEWHAKALEGLHEALGPAVTRIRRLVVTCRSKAYVRAVDDSGTILPRAAVVELEPVGIEQAQAFLSRAITKPERWQPVFDEMGGNPSGPLATALSTPLMATLARTAYRKSATDPGELLPLTDVKTVEDALIDSYVASLYDTTSRDAGRWLSCLAFHLSWTGTRELLWWQLSPGLFTRDPQARAASVRTAAVVAGAVVATLLGWLFAAPGRAWPTGLSSELGTAPKIGLVALVVLWLGSAGVFRSLWPDGYPPYVSLRYRGRGRRVLTHLGFGATFGLAAGVVSGPVLGDIALGLVAGCAHGLINSVVPAWSPRGRTGHATPRTTLGVNRRNAVAAAAQHGLIAAAVFSAGAAITPWSWQVFPVAAIAAAVFGSAAALTAGLWTWIRFRLAHAGLALVGWLPWRLFAFLDNAQERGVLRPAGTAWQFRHALVQDHLAGVAYLKARDDLDEPAAPDREPEDDLIERSRARTAGRVAAWRLAGRLGQGLLDEAVEELRARAGDGGFSWSLASRKAATGDVPGAVAALRGVVVEIELGPWRPPRTPSARREQLDRAAQLKELRDLRARANAGEWDAGRQFADLLAERGEVGELEARARAGDEQAAERLADLRADQGDLDGVVAVLRPRADAGDGRSALQLAELLAKHGRGEEAIAVLRGGYTSTRAYYWLLAEHGHLAELRALAEAGSWRLADDLPLLLERFGHLDELRAQADAGNWRAAERLARWLAEQGGFEELRTRAEAGDWYAGEWLTVRDIPHPWPKVVPVRRNEPPPVLPPHEPAPPAPVDEDEPPVLLGALKLAWRLGLYHSTNPRWFSFLASASAGMVIGAALTGPSTVGAVIAGVLVAAVLAWLLPLLRKEAAAWAMLMWRAAPKRVRSTALAIPIVVVPMLSAVALAMSPRLDAVVLAVLVPAYFVVVLGALKAVPFQDKRWRVGRTASA